MTPLKIVGLSVIGLLIVAAIVVGFFLNDLRKLMVTVPLKIEPGTQAAPAVEKWLSDLNAAEQFNGVLSVRRGGETLYRGVVGTWDESQTRPLSIDAPMRLASLSKPFTATAVLRLVDEDRIDLDAPLSTYFPNCRFDRVTVRHLLSHSSGIRDDYMSLGETRDLVTNADVVAHVCRAGATLQFPPGTRYDYNNTGYVMLAALVEAVSRTSFEAHLDAAVLQPLGLSRTRVFNRVSPAGGIEVAPTFLQWERPPEALTMAAIDGVSGDGAVHASLSDLERFAQSWIDGMAVSPSSTQAALTPGHGHYGLGWVIDPDGWVWHNGTYLGAASYMGFHPERGDWVILVDNGNSLATASMVRRLRKSLLGEVG